MSQPQSRSGQVVAFLNTVARPGCRVEQADHEQNLVDAGILDSLALIQIITWLEEEHGVILHVAGIDPAELMTIEGIVRALDYGDS